MGLSNHIAQLGTDGAAAELPLVLTGLYFGPRRRKGRMTEGRNYSGPFAENACDPPLLLGKARQTAGSQQASAHVRHAGSGFAAKRSMTDDVRQIFG